MSFHTNYEQWLRWSQPEHCPVCQNEPMPPGTVDVADLPHSWLIAEPLDCLKGAVHMGTKKHAIELFDLDDQELLDFMREVNLCARAVKNVTGCVKINYEIHGNSAPHLHLHIYPRYIDDPFPGQPINYHQRQDWYGGQAGFEHFVADLRAEISRLRGE